MPPLDATPILSALWRSSWQAGVLVFIVLALRWTLRDRLPAAWRTRLWGLVFLRLLLPAVPSSPLSLFNLLPADPVPTLNWPTLTVVVRATAVTPVVDVASPVPLAPTAERPSPLPTLLLAGWLLGAAAMATATAFAHARFAGRVRRSRFAVPDGVADLWRNTAAAARVRRPPPMVVTDAVSSPALFGVTRGRLLLPPNLWARLTTAELRLVFRHELAHARRRDLAVGWLVLGVRCVYWFHPLVWVAAAARRADAEVACDDLVLATADRDARLAYGRVLLAVAGGRRVPAAGMADARTDLRRRLARIVAGRRVGRGSAAVAGAFTLAVACAALTGADQRDNVTRTYPGFMPQQDPCFPPGSQVAEPPPEGLAELVRRTVTPDVWGHGGAEAKIVGHALVVTAPPATQAGVERLLADLTLNVCVEAQIFVCRPSQVRAAGVAVPAAGAAGVIAAADVDALLRTLGPMPFPAPPPGSLPDWRQGKWSFAADRLVRRTTLPRLTLFNGQSARLIIATQQAYVSALAPTVSPGIAELKQTVSNLSNPQVDEAVRPILSSDRRTVDLKLWVQIERLASLVPVEMTATVGGRLLRGTVQVPDGRTTTTIDAAVQLPVGGWVLLRGHTVEAVRLDGRPPATVPVAGPAAADAPDTFLLVKVIVLHPSPPTRPAAVTPATRPAARAAGPYGIDGGPIAMIQATPRVSGPYPAVTNFAAPPRLSLVPATPNVPTPDGRGVAELIPTRWDSEAARLVHDLSAATMVPSGASITVRFAPTTRPAR